MTLAVLADRYAAAAFMLAAAALFARPMPVRRARTAWIVLIVLGAGYDLALNLHKLYRGTHTGHPKATIRRARRVTVTPDSALPIEVDGEQPGLTPASFEIVPSALRLRAP